MTRHRLVLGDRGKGIRDPLDILRWSFFVGAVVTLVLGDEAAALRLALTWLATMGVRRLALPRPFDAAFLVGMSLQAWGNTAHLFTSFSAYDLIVHFVLPLACAPALSINDTIGDLTDDAVASALGGLLLVLWATRGWATTRRVPEERLELQGHPEPQAGGGR